jgi:hypothetical protein
LELRYRRILAENLLAVAKAVEAVSPSTLGISSNRHHRIQKTTRFSCRNDDPRTCGCDL